MRKLSVLAVVVFGASLGAQNREQVIEWPFWGGDAGHGKYSIATDITPANVRDLELAWTWRTVDRPMPEYNLRPGAFENTPIMVDDVLYVSTSFHRIVALDANTGAERWVFDPRTYEEGPPLVGTGLNSRGVAFWRGEDSETRVFIAGRQRLFSVDARTGKPVASFGGGVGSASLTANLGRDVPRLHTQVTSPPVVFRNLVIIGTGVPDRLQYRGDPVGTVQAFDVRTGKRAWVFFTIPQSAKDFGADTWGDASWKMAGHANVWAPMSLDAGRGLLYVPTSTPSGDYWGGWRQGANLFAESLVCLDALTGQRKWHFQAVHHGLWDYDFASAPTLATTMVDGKTVDVVAHVSKQGFTYVFERTTGRPIWPIEERAVDTTTDVPGERPYATQPFPTRPPPLVPQGISLEDANDLTPEIKVLAEEQLKRFRLGPLFTPPSLRGTVQRPSQVGAANWGGAAFDPETALLYVKANDGYHVSTVCKNDGQDPFVEWEYSNYCGQYGLFASRGPQGAEPAGQPAAAARGDRAPDTVNYSGDKLGGIPLIKPPYAYLVAIDLNRGEIRWKVPFGEGSQAIRQHPLLKGVALPERLGTQGNPGPIVTRSGLVLIGGGEPYVYAFDKASGREIARVPTPLRTSGNPMTYRTRTGRQFVVVAMGAGPEGALAAFTLRRGNTTAAAAAPGATSAAAQPGEAVYARICEPCHGPQGRNGFAPSLVPMNRSTDEVTAIVREGIGQMPPISPREVSDDEVLRIVEFLRSLGKP